MTWTPLLLRPCTFRVTAAPSTAVTSPFMCMGSPGKQGTPRRSDARRTRADGPVQSVTYRSTKPLVALMLMNTSGVPRPSAAAGS
ncbi:hypothetical protein NJ76_08505 [Rhodococcus sp. IITR03]|nr:hypothetical protein NJ76_08505 [Rhodococcus sp. IITR03]